MDHDAQPKNGNSFFTNIQIYEGTSCALLEGKIGEIADVDRSTINDVLVYPNPATDKVNVNYKSLLASNTTIEVYSITGVRVYASSVSSDEGTNQLILDVTNFSNGMYLIKIQAEGNKPVVKKVQLIKN